MSTRIAFVHIPKTGGSSIRVTYRDMFLCPPRIKTIHCKLDKLEEPFDVSFAVIREPKEWLHSVYSYTYNKPSNPFFNDFHTFSDFVLNGGLEKMEQFLPCTTQSCWVEGVDEILLFENLQEELDTFLTKHGWETKPLRHEQRVDNKKPFEISEEADKILEKHLESDYNLYNEIKKGKC